MMIFKLLSGLLLSILFAFNCSATTVHIVHGEDINVSIQDPVYRNSLIFAPKFEYPRKTIFELKDRDINFYAFNINSEEYYLWFEKSSSILEIDLTNLGDTSSDFALISKTDWYKGELESNNSSLIKLNELDRLFKDALDDLINLAENDKNYRAEKNFNTIVWDSRSAKRLFNHAVESMTYQLDQKWIHWVPAYSQYWELVYKLYYQYFHTNSFKALKKGEVKSQIEKDFNYPESKLLVFHHFFKEGLNSTDLKAHYELFEDDLNEREESLAEAIIQRQVVKELGDIPKIEFLFGLDIDAAMEGYFARNTSEMKNVLIFWSFWDAQMSLELNLLAKIKDEFEGSFNFVHICIDGYESPEKAKSFIFQNRVEGFHLIPEQATAFRSSNFRKDQKIRSMPFYLITNDSGEIIESESISLSTSLRLKNKLRYYETKK
ncbi:hypothetical protein SAMN05661096_03691 [Marivirga sericea]|uniref:Thioredoxin-like n=1 Tax=Marivirga sericea TaxID=1028 RepID=A0A1X7LBL2_9BACT|nr:hypothetical protein [Marivirga sericea]SMG50559.1 hypothetical protein SAMN05661096_03691 [Marivirga sericea]